MYISNLLSFGKIKEKGAPVVRNRPRFTFLCAFIFAIMAVFKLMLMPS